MKILLLLIICTSVSVSRCSNLSHVRSQSFERKLDISRSCQEELSILRQSDQFKVKFPQLSESEFQDHCEVSDVEIRCDLDGTSLVDDFRTICEGTSSGKLVEMNMTASGACVGSVQVMFYDFPLCAGKSCDEETFIESYEEKLKTESTLVGGDCNLDLTSGGSLTNSNYLVAVMTITLVVLGLIM